MWMNDTVKRLTMYVTVFETSLLSIRILHLGAMCFSPYIFYSSTKRSFIVLLENV